VTITIALELGNELLVRNGRLLPALCYDGQIFQVFQQFFVVGDWQNDRRAFAAIVGDVFNRITHARRLAETEAICNESKESSFWRGAKTNTLATANPSCGGRGRPHTVRASSVLPVLAN
jgi:hypothetical protein